MNNDDISQDIGGHGLTMHIPVEHPTTLDGTGPYAVTYQDEGAYRIGPAQEPISMTWAFESEAAARVFAERFCAWRQGRNARVMVNPLRVPWGG